VGVKAEIKHVNSDFFSNFFILCEQYFAKILETIYLWLHFSHCQKHCQLFRQTLKVFRVLRKGHENNIEETVSSQK